MRCSRCLMGGEREKRVHGRGSGGVATIAPVLHPAAPLQNAPQQRATSAASSPCYTLHLWPSSGAHAAPTPPPPIEAIFIVVGGGEEGRGGGGDKKGEGAGGSSFQNLHAMVAGVSHDDAPVTVDGDAAPRAAEFSVA